MEKKVYHETASYYKDMLANVRHEIPGQVTSVLEWPGGKGTQPYYHSEEGLDRYTFVEVDNDGYGRELNIDTVEQTESGEIEIRLSDTEDCYGPVWDLSDLSATDAMYLLTELEAVAKYIEETGEEVKTEY